MKSRVASGTRVLLNKRQQRFPVLIAYFRYVNADQVTKLITFFIEPLIPGRRRFQLNGTRRQLQSDL
jgi:hypothetical protein